MQPAFRPHRSWAIPILPPDAVSVPLPCGAMSPPSMRRTRTTSPPDARSVDRFEQGQGVVVQQRLAEARGVGGVDRFWLEEALVDQENAIAECEEGAELAHRIAKGRRID